MDKAGYIGHCQLLLKDRQYYEKLDANPTLIYNEKVKQNVDDMLKNNYIRKQEYNYLTESLENPPTPLFRDYQRYIKYLIYFHHYDLSSLALILAHAICLNLLILS